MGRFESLKVGEVVIGYWGTDFFGGGAVAVALGGGRGRLGGVFLLEIFT